MVTYLHGFSQRGESFRELAGAVGERVWIRPLMPDVRGTTLQMAARSVTDSWDQEGVGRSHLVGYSQGGRLALHMAVHHGDRLASLTAISAHAGFEAGAREARLAADERLAARIEAEGIDWFAAYWPRLELFAGLRRRRPDLEDQLDRARRSHDPRVLAAQLRGMGGGATEPFWDALPTVRVPALIIAGSEDAAYVSHARRLASLIPGARLEIVQAAGHVVHLEQPGRVTELLARHLSRPRTL